MKRLIATLFVALFIFSLSLSAQADSSGLAALNGKVTAFLNSGDKVALDEDGYAVTIAYYVVSSGWWTGLAIYNSSSESNSIKVGCLDSTGDVQAAGTLSLIPYAFEADLLANFMTGGSVPETGSIFISGSAPFIVDRYLGGAGGFGEIQLEAEAY